MQTFKIKGNPVGKVLMTQREVKLMRIPRYKVRASHLPKWDRIKRYFDWKDSIALQMTTQKPICHEGAVAMSFHFFLHRPNSIKKSINQHIKKPDISNLIKSVEDSLKNICYKDDNQIVSIVAQKEYASEEAGVLITLTKVPEGA